MSQIPTSCGLYSSVVFELAVEVFVPHAAPIDSDMWSLNSAGGDGGAYKSRTRMVKQNLEWMQTFLDSVGFFFFQLPPPCLLLVSHFRDLLSLTFRCA